MLPNQRMSKWRFLLKEFQPKVVHVSGVANAAVDGLFCLPMKKKQLKETVWEEPKPRLRYSDYDDDKNTGKKEDICMTMTKVLSEQGTEAKEFDDVFIPILTWSLSEFNDTYPLSMKPMLDDQLVDAKLQKEVLTLIRKKKAEYSYKLQGSQGSRIDLQIWQNFGSKSGVATRTQLVSQNSCTSRKITNVFNNTPPFLLKRIESGLQKLLQAVQGLPVSRKDQQEEIRPFAGEKGWDHEVEQGQHRSV